MTGSPQDDRAALIMVYSGNGVGVGRREVEVGPAEPESC